MEESFLQQTSQCKASLGNASEHAQLPVEYLRERLTSIRATVTGRGGNYTRLMEEYTTGVIEPVVKEVQHSWTNTEDHTLWRGLRSHEALLQTLKHSCE